MSILRNRTIKQKLVAIIMAACIISLLSAGLAFIGWQWASLRNRMVQNLSIHAAMIGDNCKAALAFEDAEAAEETLGALRVQESIIYGCIRTANDEIFATYYREEGNKSEFLIVPQKKDYYFGNKSLTVLIPITLDGEEIGMVYLLSDLQPLYTALKHNIYTIIIVISVVCLIAYLVSTKLQRVISGPILNLAEVARDVSEKKEYSARAVKQSDDEVGLLIEAFNEMLEQIQQRDSELVGSKEQLEIKVKERTEELSSSNVKLAEEIAERSSTQRELRERIKEIGCLYETSKLFEQPEISLEQIFQKTTEMLRNAYKYPELTAVRITFDGISYKTDNFETSEISQFAELWIKGKNVGTIDVYYLGERPEKGQSPFLKEEKQLLDTVAGNLARMAERKKAEEKQAELMKQLENANEELKSFAYVVSHDLKAPLRGIKTLADWISSDYADKFDEQGKEQMKLLSGRTDRMHNLIDGILQYSRIGRVEQEKVQVNLNELVGQIIDSLAPPENITITIEDELPTIECEETRITQVFQNLLSNAIKYMDKPQGQIRICCVEENGFLKFSVSDNGPGIEEKYFDKIFGMFQTLSARDEFESTGVGLTVIKKIVGLSGGRIWLESKVGEGTTFFFTLPKKEKGVVNYEKQKTHITC